MPKESVFIKYAKQLAVVLVLSLAVVGLFSILKKPPRVHIPKEDHSYIENIFGVTEFTGNSNPSKSGVSSLMDHGIIGAPPVGGSSSGTDVLPKAIGSSPNGSSEAPAFIAVPTSAIPVPTAQDTAPMFVAQPQQNLPPALKAPAALEATPAPMYGSQYPITQPITHYPIPQTPVPKPPQQAVPDEAPPFIPSITVPSTAVPTAPAPSGPTLKTTFVSPSPPNLYVPPPSFECTTEAIPVTVPAIKPAEPIAAPVYSPVYQQPEGFVVSGTENSVRYFSTTDASLLPETPAEASVVPLSAPIAQNTERQVVFIPPPFKELPKVDDGCYQTAIKSVDRPAVPAVINIENSIGAMDAATALALLYPSSPDEAAKVSFSPQMEKPVKIAAQEPVSVPQRTLIVSEPVIVEMETIPFEVTQGAAPATSVSEARVSKTPETKIRETPAETQPVKQVSANVSNSRSAPSAELRDSVVQFIDSQCKDADSGNPEKLRNAFIQLSRLYDRKELSESERNYLVPILSRIGVDVIFSHRQHVLEPAYITKEGDTADSVAASFQISPELLMKINGLTGARPLKPGTPLKVVHGQFDARIMLAKGQTVLILGGLYAGQFPVSVGKDIQNISGEFYVVEKSNSYRGKTLTLNNGVVLLAGSQDGKTLCFAEKDAGELFDILTVNSVVVFE